MRSDKEDEHSAGFKAHEAYNPIFVTADVEHHLAISNPVHSVERGLDVAEIQPGGVYNYAVPAIERRAGALLLCFWKGGPERRQG